MANINRTQSSLTLQDAKEFRIAFAKEYSLVTFALMFGAYMEGSIVLTWFIPSSIAPQLVQDLKNGGSRFLNEHSINELSIDGHAVAIVDSNKKIWNLNRILKPPVCLWKVRYTYFLQPGEYVIYHAQGLVLKLHLPSDIIHSPKIHGCQCSILVLVLR